MIRPASQILQATKPDPKLLIIQKRLVFGSAFFVFIWGLIGLAEQSVDFTGNARNFGAGIIITLAAFLALLIS